MDLKSKITSARRASAFISRHETSTQPCATRRSMRLQKDDSRRAASHGRRVQDPRSRRSPRHAGMGAWDYDTTQTTRLADNAVSVRFVGRGGGQDDAPARSDHSDRRWFKRALRKIGAQLKQGTRYSSKSWRPQK